MIEKFKTRKSIIRYEEDGVLLSDLQLAGVVLSLLNGTDCYQAIPEKDSSRFLFYIKGDPKEIKKLIEQFYSARIEDLGSKLLKKFTSKISFLKTLLDKGREGIPNGED